MPTDHWRAVLRHLYGHATHGSATSCLLFDAYVWRDGGKGATLLLPHARAVSGAVPGVVDQCEAFGAAMGTETLIETHGNQALEDELLEREYRVAYDLPVHVIPTAHSWIHERLGTGSLSGMKLRWVDDERTVADFARLQDRAYAASYGFHVGCASGFYTHPTALIGPDTKAVILYDEAGVSVRCGQVVRAGVGGFVSGISGAADPSVRGRHLGDAIWSALLRWSRYQWGAEIVLHETMPVARPIVERHGLRTLATWNRWTR